MMGLGGVGTALGGCDLPSTVTLEEGKEEVVSYLMPEEYVIPGVGVWYASTCTQCSAGCGIHGRVREGRILKLEGNPDAGLNHGNICMMGQAAVQGHYNPDRIRTPMLREGGQLNAVTWDKALGVIQEKLKGIGADRVAWLTGTLSGHQLTLVQNHLAALGSTKHYSHEVIHNAVWQNVNQDMLGERVPRLRLDKAQVVLSFGADFLGTWMASPVHFAGEYAKFRKQKQRGLLIQIEPKMSLTGGSADLWLASRSGSEGAIALKLANLLLNKYNKDGSALPDQVKDLINKYDVNTAAKLSGVDAAKLERIAQILTQRSPSLVLAGAPVEAQAKGYAAVAAVMVLNHLLGNIGQTLESAGTFPFTQLQAKQGSTRDLFEFAQAANNKQFDVVFFHGCNPAYSSPGALNIDGALANISLKVAVAQFQDETTLAADVVLPLASSLEDWGTHVAAYSSHNSQISVQQPLMEKLYEDTKGFGDIVLELLKAANAEQYTAFGDYYGYLLKAHDTMPPEYKREGLNAEKAWQAALQTGVINVSATSKSLDAKIIEFGDPANVQEGSANFPFYLVASPRLGLWDGRHANLPWLQEAPDQISKVVWDSWAEIHPATAEKLGIKQGAIIKVASEHGSVELKAVLLKGVHPEVIAIPMGQGHKGYGRYADGLGVNPLKLLSPVKEEKTGELAMNATRVNVTKTGAKDVVVKLGSSDTQHGRKLVVTVPVDRYQRTEEV